MDTKIRVIAIFLAVLIICMPLSFAVELTIIDASGRSNIRNYYKTQEQIHINASATIESDPFITPNQLRTYLDGQRGDIFDGDPSAQCPTDAALARCTYTRIAPAAGIHTYEIKLYDDSNKYDENAIPLANKTEKMISDIIPATMSVLTVNPYLVQSGKINVHSVSIDRAFNPDDAAQCTGVASVKFYLDTQSGTPFRTVLGNNQCNQTIDFEQTFPSLSDGAHRLIAVATDRFNQTDPTGQSFLFEMDASAPQIDTNGTLIRDSSTGETINYVKSENEVVVDISVPVSDPHLQNDTIRADLSAMSPAVGNNVIATAYVDGYAVWRNIPLSGFTSCTFTVRAQDHASNQVARTINCGIIVDNTGPAVVSITSPYRNNEGVMLIGQKTKLTATLSESGSGLNKNRTYLNLGDITGANDVRTDGCAKGTGDQWQCAWNVMATRAPGNKQVWVSAQSTDDLGNAAIIGPRTQAILDTDPPKFGGFSMRVIGGLEPTLSFPVQGATLEFAINSTGFDPEKSYIDLSGIGGMNKSALSCTTNACTAVAEITVCGPYRANVSATMMDPAGNSVTKSIYFDVLGLRNETPNFWVAKTVCSPALIDRSTTVLIEQKAYCDAALTSINPNVIPIAYTFSGASSCTGNTEAFSKIEAFNLVPRSTHPTFDLTLHATEYNVNSLQLKCPITIISVVNESGKLYLHPWPETEDVLMNFGFYNQPLGDVYSSVNKQVDDAVADAKDYLKIVGQIEYFFDMASKICNIKQIITTLFSAWDAIIVLLGNVERAAGYATPAAAKAAAVKDKLCGIRTAEEKAKYGENGMGQMFKWVDKLCAFVNCRMDSSDDGYLTQLGGGSKFCTSIKETLAGVGGVNKVLGPDGKPRGVPVLDEAKYTWYGGNYNTLNVKENLILSTLCMCVPGIIHNINKYRDIKCNYAICMLQDVKQNGLPPSYCENIKTFQTCNFVVGDVFNLFPIIKLWDTVLEIVKNIYANPIELLRLYSGLHCSKYCTTKFPEQYASCVYPKALAKIGDAVQSIKAIKNIANFNKQTDSCDQLETMTNSTASTGG